MSALTPIADIHPLIENVCFEPKADSRIAAKDRNSIASSARIVKQIEAAGRRIVQREIPAVIGPDRDRLIGIRNVNNTGCPFRKICAVIDSCSGENRGIIPAMLAVLYLLGIFACDLLKSRRRLQAENLFLRYQLNIALRRALPRPLCVPKTSSGDDFGFG